jgi:CheY-like chemotaxis protein
MSRVLIVEDDPATRNGLAILLEQAGYDVLATESVPEGRRALEEGAPDLLITDVRLGEFTALPRGWRSKRPRASWRTTFPLRRSRSPPRTPADWARTTSSNQSCRQPCSPSWMNCWALESTCR